MTTHKMLLEDSSGALLRQGAVPDVFGIDDQHGPVAALAETSRLVDPHAILKMARGDFVFQVAVNFGGALDRTVLAVRANEDVTFVLAQSDPPFIEIPRYHIACLRDNNVPAASAGAFL